MSDSINILIVEDNNINRRIISNIIKSLGFDPLEAENGREALRVLQSEKVSYILMDLLMPVMDGYQATKEIKKSANKNIPIIAISADQYSHLTEEMIAAGFDAVLSKPINKDDLLQTMYGLNEKKESNYTSYQVFNPVAFEQFLTDPDLRKEIVQTFLNEKNHDTKRLTKAFDSEVIDDIYNAVHYMKGSFSYLKSDTLFTLSKTILDECKSNNLDVVLKYKDELFKKYNKLLTELQFYMNTLT